MKTLLGFTGIIALALCVLALWGISPVLSWDGSQHATQTIVAAANHPSL